MSRYNQIEEMANVMVDENNNEVVNALSTLFATLAEALYTAGYRKSSEVAEEIFEEIEAVIERYINISWYTMEDVKKDLAELKKKYTEDK